MNKRLFKLVVIPLLTSFCSTNLFSQKQIIDSTAIKFWYRLADYNINETGKYAFYFIDSIKSRKRTLIIQSTQGDWSKTFPGASNPKFSNGKAFFQIPGDTLCIITLGTETALRISHVDRFSLASFQKDEWLAYLLKEPKRSLILWHTGDHRRQVIDSVVNYELANNCSALVIQQNSTIDTGLTYQLLWINLIDGKWTNIWKGSKAIVDFSLNYDSDKLSFIAPKFLNGQWFNTLWYYSAGMKTGRIVIDSVNIKDTTLVITTSTPHISKDGHRIFFKVSQKDRNFTNNDGVKVDVWRYADYELQSDQLTPVKMQPKEFQAVVDIEGKNVRLLQETGELLFQRTLKFRDSSVLVVSNKISNGEYWYDSSSLPKAFLISTLNGSKQPINIDLKKSRYFYNFNYPTSPNGRWLLFFDDNEKAYFTYDTWSKTVCNISKGIPTTLLQDHIVGVESSSTPGLLGPYLSSYYDVHWFGDNSGLLIYDRYDIWQVDPHGVKRPVNITNGYGRANRIRFKVAHLRNVDEDSPLDVHHKLLLLAFNTVTKYSGFYSCTIKPNSNPIELSMGPWSYQEDIVKASKANLWLVSRMSSSSSTNVYLTNDFIRFRKLSDIQPESKFNWLTSNLVYWDPLDSSFCGVFYKPENFDSTKKYPVILTYYEFQSDKCFNFQIPLFTNGSINVPYFVSQGYLVFVPDVYYKVGHPGQSALKYISSAARYLATLPWVNPSKMALNGHSWGGYETNYIITHSNLFAAAAEAAGPTDLISGFGGLRFGQGRGSGENSQFMYEIGQFRLGAALWNRPDLYIENSPIFSVANVSTPLLMLANKGDDNVPFEQAIEFYLALFRLGKKVWLLQYDDQGHIVVGKAAVDYTIRLNQFYNYYLKDAPPPKWMTQGIPAILKGVEQRYELDSPDQVP